ncbi:MAG TPA: hypothetical protein VKR59_07770 [Terriglobales bacterium]|nr:hypothetical protein [Terriglobales bacterium]
MKVRFLQKLAALGIHNAANSTNDNLYLLSDRTSDSHSRFIPPFSFNDEQLRLVICHRAWRYIHGVGAPPDTFDYECLNDYASLNKSATKKARSGYDIDSAAPERQHEILSAHIKAVRRAGGYMELQLAIAWRAWRQGQPSPEIAASLGVSPWMVRQSLRRLRGIAGKLGFDVGRRVHNLRVGPGVNGGHSY